MNKPAFQLSLIHIAKPEGIPPEEIGLLPDVIGIQLNIADSIFKTAIGHSEIIELAEMLLRGDREIDYTFMAFWITINIKNGMAFIEAADDTNTSRIEIEKEILIKSIENLVSEICKSLKKWA